MHRPPKNHRGAFLPLILQTDLLLVQRPTEEVPMAQPTTAPDLLPHEPEEDWAPTGPDTAFAAEGGTPTPVVSLNVTRSVAAMLKRSTLLSDAKFSLTVPYLVKGWLFEGQTSIVYAPSNAGKTSWVLDITRSITADEDWHGYRTKTGRSVLYIAAEAPGSIFRRTALFSDAAKGRFIVLDQAVDLVGDPEAGDKIAALVDLWEKQNGMRISLVVIDTLTLCFGDGDENSTRDAGRAIASAKVAAEKTGAHVMLIHHTGKDRSAGARGSYAITGNSDTVIELVPVEGEEKTVVALQRKQREAGTDESLAFKIVAVKLGTDEDDDTITTSGIEVVGNSADARRMILRKSKDRAMEAVMAALRALEAAPGGNAAGFKAAEIAEACAETFKPDIELASRARIVRDVLKQAAEAKSPLVVKHGDRYRTTSPARESA
jgi:hypothetical protein